MMYKIAFFLIVILVIPFMSIGEGVSEWSVLVDMPTPRTEVTASTIGSRIYVVGGFDAVGDTSSVIEVYDPRSNTWSEGKQLPIALHHAAATSYEGKLYIVGGYSEGWIPSSTLFIYDPLTNEWTRSRDMSTPRGALTSQFINGILYAVGGWNIVSLSANEAYDPVTNTWTTKSSMPTTREHLASGVIDGKLYVIGGRQGSLQTNLNVNEEYDPVTNTWTTKSSMPTNRGGIVASSLYESIYVFGGETSTGTFYDNEQYIPSLDIWLIREMMPTARHGLAAVEAGGSIYVIGGGINPGFSVSGKNEVFTPVDWKKTINVNIIPSISIEPKEPLTDDKIKITVSFDTNTSGYIVKFNELIITNKILTTDVIVIPPPANMLVAQVKTHHSHTYTLEKLTVGDYMFSISINDQKNHISERFRVEVKTLFIDVLHGSIKEVNVGTPIVFQHDINNGTDLNQSFIHILQIIDENGITISLTWSTGELMTNESKHVSKTWINDNTGKYTLQFFVWESMENPKVFDSMHEIIINMM
ncbi:MAG: hypothetical protein CMO16_04375 [Thaumarchaeota archaeon]|nr:hypothetical protein [Nitrososphaerota archaeon]